MQKPKSKFPNARTTARERGLQALYQWQLTGQSLQEIELQFLLSEEEEADEHREMKHSDIPHFKRLLHGVPEQMNKLDELITPLLDRDISLLDPVELTILRMGCYELKHCTDVPFRVAINEAVELAKRFGAEKSYKYVNGVLDKIAKQKVPTLAH